MAVEVAVRTSLSFILLNKIHSVPRRKYERVNLKKVKLKQRTVFLDLSYSCLYNIKTRKWTRNVTGTAVKNKRTYQCLQKETRTKMNIFIQYNVSLSSTTDTFVG